MRPLPLAVALMIVALVVPAPAVQAGTQVKALVSMAERCPLEQQVDPDRCTMEERLGVFALWEAEACADSAAVVEYVVLSREERRHDTVSLAAGQCIERDGLTFQQVGDCMTVIVTVTTLGQPLENLRGSAEDTECSVAAYGDVVNTEGYFPFL